MTSLEDKAWFQLLHMAAIRQSKLKDYLAPASSTSADDDNHTIIENGKL